MAMRPEDAIPSDVMSLAKLLEVPSPDWYVGSAESGRGTSLRALLRDLGHDAGESAQAERSEPELPAA